MFVGLILFLFKRKQCLYKPGSVPSIRMASVIYLVHKLPHESSVLPSIAKISGGQPSNDGLRELAASRWHSPMITHRLVVSYTTFSPLPMIILSIGGCFLLPYLVVTNNFYFQKWNALCCPDFPPAPFYGCRRQNRSTVFCMQNYKINLYFIFFSMMNVVSDSMFLPNCHPDGWQMCYMNVILAVGYKDM